MCPLCWRTRLLLSEGALMTAHTVRSTLTDINIVLSGDEVRS
ncbi:MAG: hypothetical protein RLZZ623_3566 [Actinomycetota bacterium]